MRKLKLFMVACALMGSAVTSWAQTDVTSTYLTNADFEDGENGWTYQTSSGTHYHGVSTYGSNEKINNIAIINSDKFGNTSGKAACTAAGWGTVSYYTQNVTLPAGEYKITFDIFNNRNTTGGTSRLGWIPDGGDASYSKTEFTYYMWRTHSVSFTLTSETSGKISIGIASVSGSGSGSCAHIYIDNVKIFKMDEGKPTISNPVDYSDLINQSTWSYNEDDGNGSATALTTNVNKGAWPYRHAERYRGTSGHYGKKLYQTITDLPAGVYQVKASCMSAAANNVEGGNALADGTLDNAYFYANNEETTYPLANATSAFQTQIVTLTETGNIEFGVKTVAVGANWNAIGCATLIKLANNQSDYLADLFATYYALLKEKIDEADEIKDEEMDDDESSALASALSTANEMYEGKTATSISEIEDATSSLNTAITNARASMAKYEVYNNANTLIGSSTNVDLTSMLSNPSFELGNTTGWTNDGSITANAQNNTSFDNKQGTYYCERWHVAGTVDINQTIAYLPAGIYKVEAYMYSDVPDAKLYVNSEDVSVSNSRKYQAVVTIADKGSIKIGASCTLTGETWICMDDFKLTYLAANIAELPYTLATGKMGTDKATAQTTAETTFTSNPTMDNYNALLTAIAEAEASKTNYAKLKAAIDKANDVLEANNFVTSDAATTFANEISTATAAWTDVTYTDAQATAEITTLGTAISGHRGNATGKAGNYIVSAWDTNTNGQTEGNWDGYYINTWSTEGDNDGSGFSVPFFEYYVENNQNLPTKTMTATLSGLENGAYDVSIWVRARERSDSKTQESYKNRLTMTVNDGEAVSLLHYSTPIDANASQRMFLGRSTARGVVTDGTLTVKINVNNNDYSNIHWLSWRDVKYTKVADESITVTDAGFATYVSDNDLDYSGVTGLKAYKATVSENTITFERVTTVPAGEGVLLRGAGTYNVPVTAGVTAWNAEDNAFIRGTGDAVETGSDPYNYILNNVNGVIGFYRAAGQTVATNRAYLQTTTNAARLNISFDDDDQTTGIARVEETVANDAVYTLSGVRVEKPTKGLYIKNGKKVVIK